VAEIVGTIGKAILLAVVGTSASILVTRFLGGSEDKPVPQYYEDEHRPNYRF